MHGMVSRREHDIVSNLDGILLDYQREDSVELIIDVTRHMGTVEPGLSTGPFFKKSFTILKEDQNNVNQESGSDSRRRKLAD